jgi:hypothetical protein
MTLHNIARQQLLGNLTQPQPDETAQLKKIKRVRRLYSLSTPLQPL